MTATRQAHARQRIVVTGRPARRAWRIGPRSGRLALVAALGSIALLPLLTACGGARANSASAEPIQRVGLMHVGIDHVPSSLTALATQLGDKYGWEIPAGPVKACAEKLQKRCNFKGHDIELMWRNLEPDQALPQAKAFVRERVDVIVAFEDQSIRAAQEATSRPGDRIPIVFLHPSDPVRSGLVKSLAHPGGQLTGVFGARDLVGKQLELYELLVPDLHRMLTLVNPEDPATKSLLAQYELAASQLPRKLTLDIRNASSAGDLERVFRSLRPGEVDGAFLLSPTLRLNYTALTLRLAARAHLPVQAHRKDWVQKGALFSYGADLEPVGRAGARYVDSILRGTPPAKLPVQEVPNVDFAINLTTAARLGIKVPEGMIVRADEVYR